MNDSMDRSAETPVSAMRVARRALILAAVVCRGSIDSSAGQPEAESLHKRILDWLTTLNLWDEVELPEEKALRAALGRLDEKEVIRITWYAEGLGVLAWALNRLDLPRHDEKVDAYAVADSVSFLSEDAAEVISAASLRSPAGLNAYRETLYAIHCRLRGFLRNKDRKNFTNWIEKAWIEVLGLDPARLIAQDDLAIDGKPLMEVEDRRLRECEWVTCERHRAIIWLCGEFPIYSQTPVDT